MIEIIQMSERRAAKAHACFACGASIPAGELHAYAVLKDGPLYAIREHIPCRDEVRRLYREGVWAPGDDYGEGVLREEDPAALSDAWKAWRAACAGGES